MRPDVYFHIREGNQRSALAIGPGKIALLEAIAETGSLTSAAKQLKMSYRRAWLLMDETNRCLVGPAVETAAGGSQGGGTKLTRVGNELVSRYRALEQEMANVVVRQLKPVFRTSPKREHGKVKAVRKAGGR
ncbi:MAG: winged helix-turn-helix domain-containing protein [Sulfurifustis sp.]